MRVTIGGQEFVTTKSVNLEIRVHPDTREEFEIEANKMLALDPAEFLEPDVRSVGSTAWVSRTSRDDSVEVTVFAFEDDGAQGIIDHLAGA